MNNSLKDISWMKKACAHDVTILIYRIANSIIYILITMNNGVGTAMRPRFKSRRLSAIELTIVRCQITQCVFLAFQFGLIDLTDHATYISR